MGIVNEPLRKTMCSTCPFRAGSPYAFLVPDLTESAMITTQICHSTGSNNAVNRRTGIKPHICRGARQVQLKVMHQISVIDAPTDAAWNRSRVMMGMKETVVKDPVSKA